MIDWPDDLVADIARRRSVLFLGAGVSKNAATATGERPKDWLEFLRHATTKVSVPDAQAEIKDRLDKQDFLTACELIRFHLKPDAFKGLLLQEYNKPYVPGAVFNDIVALDSRYVITTNFDKIYETHANRVQHGTVLVKNYYDDDLSDVLRRTERVVIKIHGTMDSADRTIFTRSAYASARVAHAHSYQILDALFMTHTSIFLGASMRDPDMQLLLEEQTYRFPGRRPHFVVMPNDTELKAVLPIMEETMNIRPILYDPVDHHKELADGLGALRGLVDQARDDLTRTFGW